MEVSKLLPPLIAQMEEPLPRWQVIRRSSRAGRPSISASSTLDNGLDRFLYGSSIAMSNLNFVRLVAGVGQHAVNTDTLAQALGHNLAGGGVEQLVLQRRTAALITNFHLQKLPSCRDGGLPRGKPAHHNAIFLFYDFGQMYRTFCASRSRCKCLQRISRGFAGHGRKIVPMRYFLSQIKKP